MKTLKTLVLGVALTMAGTANTFAQDDAENRLRVGAKAGFNFSNVYDESGEEFVADGKMGFAGGAFLSIPIGDFLGIQPEIMFSQKGFQAHGSFLGFDYGMTRTSNFIDVPVLLALRPVPSVTIFAGPQFSYLVSQRDEFTSDIGGFDVEQEFDNDDIRRNILGFSGGLDFNISHVVIGARAGFDFQENQGDGTSDTPRYKNSYIQGTIGLRF